jgi:hypothetical protein
MLAYQPETFSPTPREWRPGIARMTNVIDRNEKCYWLLQVRLTPFNASKAGIKYDPKSWSGTPLIRVIWVNRGGHLAEWQEWLEDGEEVQVPAIWELSVEEVIYEADQYSQLGKQQTEQWMWQAQAESTLIEDAVEQAFQLSEMANNRSQFGPSGKTQRNGFPQALRQKKFLESARSWKT